MAPTHLYPLMSKESIRVKAWRLANPEKAKAVRQNWLNSLRQLVLEAKSKGCKVCGENHPACLDFHHRDPSLKLFNIGVSFGSYSIKKMKEEIAKCDVICSNCHRKLHAAERESAA